ncbi:MAG: hypothetical protein HFG80_11830 [Eubacterium sp.]|nr:hypothetical protein [Eubacterium sp.]
MRIIDKFFVDGIRALIDLLSIYSILHQKVSIYSIRFCGDMPRSSCVTRKSPERSFFFKIIFSDENNKATNYLMKGMKKYERKNKQKGFTVSSAPSGFTVDYICLLGSVK